MAIRRLPINNTFRLPHRSANTVNTALAMISPTSVIVIKSPIRKSENPKACRYAARMSVDWPYATSRTIRCRIKSAASRGAAARAFSPSSSDILLNTILWIRTGCHSKRIDGMDPRCIACYGPSKYSADHDKLSSESFKFGSEKPRNAGVSRPRRGSLQTALMHVNLSACRDPSSSTDSRIPFRA